MGHGLGWIETVDQVAVAVREQDNAKAEPLEHVSELEACHEWILHGSAFVAAGYYQYVCYMGRTSS